MKAKTVNHLFSLLIFLCFLVFPSGCGGQKEESTPPPSSPMEGEFWKQQAIHNIIIPWTRNGMNSENHTFSAYMDRRWQPFQGNNTYPGMLARHIFSYSTAYLLTGKDRYLNMADQIVQYMIQNGWDRQEGLWFNELDGEGSPVDADKDLFMQLYAVTGLSMYYVVTRDETTLDYIQNSIDLLNVHAWDSENGGYYNGLSRDLSAKDDRKLATPQLAPLSGYLAYLYPTTKKEPYLHDMERGANVILKHMMDPQRGWLLESFDKFWKIDQEPSGRINVGHNIEIVWMLLRLHLLTGKEDYKRQALDLYPRLYEVAFNEETGAWYYTFHRTNPEEKPGATPWWIQAYGNMLELYMLRITGEQKHLDRFQNGAEFWNDHFIDKEYGGAFLSVGIDGNPDSSHKAVRSKTSYHSMEHGLLNYLYLNLWVEDEPVTLYFKIHKSGKGEKFYPHIIEDPEIKINAVKINGKPWDQYNADQGSITLPALNKGSVRVELVSQG